MHPQHQTQLVYGWILKGERKAIATTGKQYHLNIMGGICLNGHRIVYQQVDQVNANSIAGFLCELRNKHPGKCKIHVIWDRVGYHRDQTVQEFAKSLAIKLLYLPPYSPNLNPIERLWKLMHENLTYNRHYATFKEFTEATLKFFKTIEKQKTALKNRITDNFHVLHSPLFAP